TLRARRCRPRHSLPCEKLISPVCRSYLDIRPDIRLEIRRGIRRAVLRRILPARFASAPAWGGGQVYLHRAELFRPCRRSRNESSERTGHLYESDLGHLRAE